MVRSQNGYEANNPAVLETFTAGGRKWRFRRGATGFLLAHFIEWWHHNIRPIDVGVLDDWSYAERKVRGGADVSNHASGTAADIDATKWPLGADPHKYLTQAEIDRVHAQLRLYGGCIRWGADYDGRKDPMHVEIDRDEATCERVARGLGWGGGPAPIVVPSPPAALPPPPPLPAWSLPRGHFYGLITGPAVSHGGINAAERAAIQAIQRRLIAKRYVPGITDWRSGWADGRFEGPTRDAVARFQRAEMPGTTRFGEVWADDYRQLGR